MKTVSKSKSRAWRHAVPPTLIVAAIAALGAPAVRAAVPITTCDVNGIAKAVLVSDIPTLPTTTPPNDTSATILSVSTGTTTTSGVPYCLVKVLVQPAINIWVGLPMGTSWNGRLQSEGGGGFGGSVKVPTSIDSGYVGVQTDTGHSGNVGTFAMATPTPNGTPNPQLQEDFAYRSEHLMAVIGKELAQAFYGVVPTYSYWNGCSTGGRQGLEMAQKFPSDYNGILAGAPAVFFDRLGIAQIWPQVPSYQDLPGGPMSTAKLNLAVAAAVSACDANDGVVDGVLTDPRTCTYNPVNDPTITKASCASTDGTCLSPAEAGVILKVWNGPTNAQGRSLWAGYERGAALTSVAGTVPQDVALGQGQYWIYFDPSWGPQQLNYANIQAYMQKTMQMMNSVIGSDSPDLSTFRNLGGKIVMWQGFADYDIPSEDSILYYDSVNSYLGGGYAQTQQFFRHFMAPGVGHCGGGSGPQPVNQFQAVVNWVENGQAPATIMATKTNTDGSTQTRPLCPYPALARYVGSGSTNDPTNFVCAPPP